MMMHTFNFFAVALLLLIIKVQGDDNVGYPNLPRQAEFTIESIILDGQHKRTFVECIYNYDSNELIIISDQTFEKYNYATLKKATYWRNDLKTCDVYPIDVDNPLDGFSAVTDPNDSTTHIRPLEDFLLLTSNAMYFNQTTLRGAIGVNQWKSSISNDSEIIWSFADSNVVMPWNPNNYTIPVQRLIVKQEDQMILQVLNIFSFKPMITRTDLTPPRGIFCPNLVPPGELLSLQNIGLTFPNTFSVRIDASTTSQRLWHSVHLRYRLTDERKLLRFDYSPFDNTQHPKTIIQDYSNDASRSYIIDRRTGSCVIENSMEIMTSLSILHSPIETLIKFENLLLLNPPHRLFQYSGNRPCRGSILCSIFVGQLPLFPPDTEEDWAATNIEWGWSKKNLDDINAPYDYPVYLNLNLYRKTNGPPSNVHYEFYDYRTDVHLNEFDVNLCYRSNQLWYLHLEFQLKISDQQSGDGIERPYINRRRLAESIRARMMNTMSVKYLRISQLELDHHPNQPGHDDSLYCIFTLLDRTPSIGPSSEIELLDAKVKLEADINAGEFKIETEDRLMIEAVPNTLNEVQYFYAFNPNASVNEIDYFGNTTVHVNRTIEQVTEEIHEKIRYSDGAQAAGVIGGMFVGIAVGTLIVFIVISLMKRKAQASSNGGLNFQNISFRIGGKRANTDQGMITMEHPTNETNETST